jgi:hypothetical protein
MLETGNRCRSEFDEISLGAATAEDLLREAEGRRISTLARLGYLAERAGRNDTAEEIEALLPSRLPRHLPGASRSPCPVEQTLARTAPCSRGDDERGSFLKQSICPARKSGSKGNNAGCQFAGGSSAPAAIGLV